MTVCPIHRVRLLERCPSCGKKPRWITSSVTACHCGADLRAVRSEAVPASEIAGAGAIQRLLHTTPDALDEMAARLGVGGLLRLVHMLGTYAVGVGERQKPLAFSVARPDLAHRVLDEGWRACEDWPKSYHTYLDRRLASGSVGRRTGSRYGVHRAFGALYTSLVRLQDEPFGALALDALNDFVAARPAMATRAPEVRRKRAQANAPSSFITMAVAMSILGTGHKALKAYADRHGLVVSGGGKGAPRLFRATDVEELRKTIAASANRKQAYAILGVSKKVFKELVDAGIVPPPSSGPLTELRKVEAWPVADLEAIVTRLEQHVFGSRSARKAGLTVAQAARAGSHLGLGTVDVIRAVMDGVLVPCGLVSKAKGIRRLLFRASDVSAWVERLGHELAPTLCINDAARRLQAKPEVCYQWVNHGLLPTVSVPGDRAQMGRRVCEDDITAFRRNYVTATWLQDEGYGLGKALAERIIKLGVEPVSGPSVDGLRLYLFRRADVEAITYKLPRKPRRAPTKLGTGCPAKPRNS